MTAPDKLSLASICVPTYKGGEFLERAIRSILASTYENIEIIVTDDTPDGAAEGVVRGFNDRRIMYGKNKTKLSVPGNWNEALKRAQGQFVGLLNHDDEYGPFWIQYALNILNKNPLAGWVISSFRIIDPQGITLNTQLHLGESRTLTREEAFLHALTSSGFGMGYIARREWLEGIGPYETAAGPYADYNLFIRMAIHYPVYYSNNPLHLAWRTHRDNLTNQLTAYDRAFHLMRTVKKTFADERLPSSLSQYKKYCYAYMTSLIKQWIQLAAMKNDEAEHQRLRALLEANEN